MVSRTPIIKNSKLLTSYQAGLLQAKAHKALKVRMSEILEPFKMSTIEWAMLGMLKDNPQGLRSLALSTILGVEPPFVTVLSDKLQKKDFVSIKQDTVDKRAKVIAITENGSEFVKTTEKLLKTGMKSLLHDLDPKELNTYLSVLQKIVDNYEDYS